VVKNRDSVAQQQDFKESRPEFLRAMTKQRSTRVQTKLVRDLRGTEGPGRMDMAAAVEVRPDRG